MRIGYDVVGNIAIIKFDRTASVSSKKKFEYEFKFVNIQKPGYEIGALELVEYLKEVTKNIENRYLDSDNVSVKDSKLYH